MDLREASLIAWKYIRGISRCLLLALEYSKIVFGGRNRTIRSSWKKGLLQAE